MSEWQPIETAPKMRKIIVYYLNALGKGRTVMACNYTERTLEHEDIDTDDGYSPPGWYEETESGEPLQPVDGEPTHWMPLPAPPAARESAS